MTPAFETSSSLSCQLPELEFLDLAGGEYGNRGEDGVAQSLGGVLLRECRLEFVVEELGRKISAVGPGDRSPVRVDEYLCEFNLVLQRLKDGSPYLRFKVDLT